MLKSITSIKLISLLVLTILLCVYCIPLFAEAQTTSVQKTNSFVQLSLRGGNYSKAQTIKIIYPKNYSVYYTTDNSTPTNKKTKYVKPITVSKTTTLKYIYIYSTGKISKVYSEVYVIKPVPTPKPPSTPATDNRYINTVFQNVQIEKDIVYGEAINYKGENEQLKLDMFLPEGDKLTKRPVILWIHGGGFTSGSKDSGVERRFAVDFAKRGYVCVSINYRLRPDITNFSSALSDAVSDSETAVTWLVKNSNKYGLDPSHIAVAGYSAGAFTAINLCYNDSKKAQWPKKSIFATIDLSGNNLNFGIAVKGDPPCIIFHGKNDVIVPYEDSAMFYDNLKSSGVTSELVLLDEIDHNIGSNGYHQILPNVIRFLYKQLTGLTIKEDDGKTGGGIKIKKVYSNVEYNARQINFKLDGKLDEWSNSELVPLKKIKNEDGKQISTNDNSRKAMIGWNSSDPTHLYLAAVITDNTYKSIHDGKTNPWENDTFEIMLDFARNGKVKNFPLYDFIFDINGKDYGGFCTDDNMDFTVTKNGNQFVYEASIDLTDKAPNGSAFRLTAGDCIGTGVLYNDWNENTSQIYSWSSATVWDSLQYTKVIFNKEFAK
jgi:acetyl esterase/lipase